MRAIIVFLATFWADLAWTAYIESVARQDMVAAPLWSALIVALGLITTVAVVQSRWYVFPAMLGAAAGTWVAMAIP